MVPSFPVRPIASSSRRLVRILCPIVEAFMLAVLDAGHDLPLGGSVAAQFVGDQHTRRPQLPFQKLAEQAFGGLLVAPALDQNVENEALLVNRAPEPMLRASDRDDDLRACNPVGFITPPMRLLHRRLRGGSRDSDDGRRPRAYRSAPLFARRGRAAPSPCSSASAASCSCVWR